MTEHVVNRASGCGQVSILGDYDPGPGAERRPFLDGHDFLGVEPPVVATGVGGGGGAETGCAIGAGLVPGADVAVVAAGWPCTPRSPPAGGLGAGRWTVRTKT